MIPYWDLTPSGSLFLDCPENKRVEYEPQGCPENGKQTQTFIHNIYNEDLCKCEEEAYDNKACVCSTAGLTHYFLSKDSLQFTEMYPHNIYQLYICILEKKR